jgi:hypothetical protein
MATTSVYDPMAPARRPGRRPDSKPKYRVLVHKRFRNHYDQLVTMVGLQQAQHFWDHVSANPGAPCPVASTRPSKVRLASPKDPAGLVLSTTRSRARQGSTTNSTTTIQQVRMETATLW